MTSRDEQILHYLLVFDHEQSQLIQIEEFGQDSDAAIVAYAEREAEFADHKRVEVVLLGSDSLETVKVTHANYFGSPRTSKYLAGI